MCIPRPLLLLVLLPLLVLGCDSNDPDIGGADLAAFRAAVGCNTVGQITMGQSLNGALSANDCQSNQRPARIDYYAFQLSSSTTVRIDQESDEIDAYLYLFSPDGSVITQNDDGGDDLNARITRQLSAGLYVIGATSWGTNETGPYTLRLNTN